MLWGGCRPQFLFLFLWLGLAARAWAAPDPANLELASVNAAVAYMDDGDLIYSKHPDRSVPIASVTKLMTAVVVMDAGQPLDEWIEVYKRHRAAPNNGYSRIRIGSSLKRGDMLRIALMSSENLAAYTLARHYPGGFDAFVGAMNAKARELGMTHSHFVEPTGLSPKNHSSAGDLVKLVRAAFRHPELRRYTTTEYYTAHFRQPRYSLAFGNTNVLVHRKSWQVELSKTGYLNEAGRCLILVTRVDGREVISVLLDSFGTRTPIGDAGRVKRWLTTGHGGAIARAARDYENRRNAYYAKESTGSTATTTAKVDP
ncbi:D-alanyl-D-alanine endopeptidase [Marinobacter halodurans]|uniref:D-alanyl-D-alanine endopeptidase n=1 Tax=Marinobacter halodurans TaxID=2528979 RepID=A0ABY1ZTH7_9GAMM|nr:D-alanyl-D-alanine endopeptidase [Marinobacter halodurans]TBW58793.1 D-alanyl-D-alanine endopeptidase [Marinobacter halodurans]